MKGKDAGGDAGGVTISGGSGGGDMVVVDVTETVLVAKGRVSMIKEEGRLWGRA